MKKELQADLMLGGVALLWGSSNFVVTICQEELTSLCIIMLRFILASLVIALIGWKKLRTSNRTTIWYAFLMGIFLCSNYFFCTVCLEYTTISNAGFFCGLAVVFTPLAEWLLFRKRPGRKLLGVLLLCIAGFLLMTMKGDFSINRETLPGDLMALACSICYTGNILITDRAAQRPDTDAFNLGAWQIIFTAVFGLGLTFVFSQPAIPQRMDVLLGIVFLGVFCTALAFVIQPIAQQYTSSVHVSLILTLEPVFCAFIAFFFAGERLLLHNYLGMFLLLAGILIMEIDPAEFRQKSVER